MCESKGSRKRTIGHKEFEHILFVNKVGVESEKFKKRRKKGRGVYRYESVVLGISKNLVGVGDPQLRTKDSNVNLFFFLVCEALI